MGKFANSMPGEAMRLLIVDDSSMIRTRISAIIEGKKLPRPLMVVASATNGADAVQKSSMLKPDLVTMDLTMPGMDGVTAIKQIMMLPDPPDILVVSALNDKSTAIAALRMGARGFLTKPFTDSDLRLALLELMENKQPQ